MDQKQEVWLGMNIMANYKGTQMQGKVVAIDGKAYKVRFKIKDRHDSTVDRFVWAGEGAAAARTKDAVVRKKGIIGLVSAGLSVAGVVFFFNPEVSMVIDLLQSLLEAL